MIDSLSPNLDALRDSSSQPTAGARLRAAREAQGLHIAMLAFSLKVPVKKLEALEADQFDVLSDTVFVRALASSVCRALKIDAVEVLDLLPHAEQPKIKTDEFGLNAKFTDASKPLTHSFFVFFKRPFVWVMSLLFMGILVLAFWPNNFSLGEWGVKKSVLTQADAPVSSPSQKPMELTQQATDAKPLKPDGVPLVLTAQDQMAPVPTLEPTSAPTVQGGEIIAKSASLLVLRALGESWVEVIDAKGVVQLRRIMTKDESVSLSGDLPIFVVLGRADQIEVTLRGQLFDAVSIAKNNVSRFEVKE